MEYRSGLLAPEVSKERKDTPRIIQYPVNSSRHSLEDGEIVEAPLSSSIPGSQQPDNQPHSSKQAIVPVLDSHKPGESNSAHIAEPMTNEDLERAKSLVLDLLGWGVTPEYLVECGLSPGAVYKIFTDLRLRLPRNMGPSSTPALFHGGA